MEPRDIVRVAPADASGVVVGAPGAGKTRALVERVRALVAAGVGVDELVVLTPTRQTATALRDELAFAVGRATAGPLARSVSSFAFQIVRAAAAHDGDEAPRLLTAGDEDRIVQDLLDGDAEDEAAGLECRWPAWIDPGIRATPGFRGEVRAFLAECASLGLDPRGLRALARRADVPVWGAMASFAAEYADVRARMRGAHRDAAGLEHEAAAIVRAGRPERIGAAAGLRAVLVDDAQELTAGAVELLEALRARGAGVVAFGDPDVGSGAFRGARPEHLAGMAQRWGMLAVLGPVWRGTAVQRALVRSVTEAIGTVGIVAHRAAVSAAAMGSARDVVAGASGGDAAAGARDGDGVGRARGGDGFARAAGGRGSAGGREGDGAAGVREEDGSVRALVARSAAEEFDAIARTLRERHVHDGVPWAACAVIAHDSRQVRALEAELSAREVPARAAGAGVPLGSMRPVRDLLRIVGLAAADPGTWTPDDVTSALLGAGLDPAEVRRLRVAARLGERAAGGERSTADLLVSGMAHPLEWGLLGTREGKRAARVAETVGALREGLAHGATAHELLWTAWERSGSERRWSEAARGRGVVAQQARRDLEAVAGLFQAAKRFSEHRPDEPLVFVRGLRDAAVAEDRLDAAADGDQVRVLTPAAAIGLAFDTVVVAGVQEGVWPNTRPRGSLLETWRLAEGGAADAARDRRRSMLHDELRLFVRACSRASARLVVTAVDDDDTGPSVLFSFLPEPERWEQRAAVPLSLRGLVALHRRTLTEPGASVARQEHAAGQLALLADAGVPGADPSEWYGVEPASSAGALRGEEAVVRVSPSRLHAIEECALNWAIGELGGEDASAGAGLGTLLHEALETTAGADEETLWAAVEARWAELEFDAAWRDRAERVRARDMVRRLALYVRRFEEAGGRLVGAEPRFDIPIPEEDPARPAGRTILSGYIDRVELTAEGEVVIVDLKTGKREPQTDDKVADHPQLAAYQLAHEAGAIAEAAGLPLAGARLLVLRPTARTADYRTPHQPPFDDETRAAFLARVRAAADIMRGSGFLAPYEEHCRDDHSYGLCRIHTIGAVSAS